jgi:hypothetical protein
VTPSVAGAVDTQGAPIAYVVNLNGAPNVFEVVTGGLSNGTFVRENGDFSAAVFCKQS